MLAKEKPEIVIVATPTTGMPFTAIASLKAGAHILEKPTGHTIQSRAMTDAAKAADRVQVGLHRRVGPHHVSNGFPQVW